MKKLHFKERLLNRVNRCVQSPYALLFLFIVSFTESSFFPIPPDLFLIPLVLYRRNRAFYIAGLTTLASVLGGFFGYAIGYFLYQKVGVPVLDFYHYTAQFESFCARYNDYGPWVVFGAGLTPFPYKIITIASGVSHLNLMTFTVASVLSRGLRFYLLSWLLWKFGPKIQTFIHKNFGWLSVALFVLIIGGFLLLKLF